MITNFFITGLVGSNDVSLVVCSSADCIDAFISTLHFVVSIVGVLLLFRIIRFIRSGGGAGDTR